MEFLNDHHSTLIEVFDDTTVCKIKFSQDSLQSHKKHTAYDSSACRTTFSSNNLKFFMTLTISYIIIYNIDLVHGGFEKLVDIWALTGSLQDLDCSLFQPFCWRFDVMIGITVLVASPNAGQAESFEQLASNWFLVHGQLSDCKAPKSPHGDPCFSERRGFLLVILPSITFTYLRPV